MEYRQVVTTVYRVVACACEIQKNQTEKGVLIWIKKSISLPKL